MKDELPFCSIIILNYFGEKVISQNLDSILKLNYPKNLYEIIVVDNNSKDKSKLIIKKYSNKYKNIKVIFSQKNLGFAGGNNLGIKEAKGEYVILLNNDCFVDKNWLINLVKCAEKDKNIFSVNSKILFYPKYFIFKIKKTEEIYIQSCYLYKSKLLRFINEKKLILKIDKNNKNYYQIEIPYDIKDKEINIILTFKKLINKENLINIYFGKEFKSYEIINKNESKDKISYKIKISPLLEKSYEKYQNLGVVVFQDGYGRDIGSIVRYQTQDYEKNLNQYNTKKEIYASCGAALLYRKEILNKIGYLDDSFFMYYEDVEICERARLYGYKIIYCPKAIVRHLHALSSKEWSPFFIYHAEKGRLLHILYHFPLKVFFKEYLKFTIRNLLKFFVRSNNLKSLEINYQYLKIILYFLLNFPYLIFRRYKKHLNINKKNIMRNYQKILEGYWYFN